MGAIQDIYEDLDADISIEEFREAVEEKVEQMGGLADEETAAMLVAHEFDDDDVGGVADIEPGMEEVNFIAKVIGVGELRTFERDNEDEDGRVVNVEAADETGAVRLAFWDEQAQAVVDEELGPGTILRVRGRPKEGFNGLEVSVYKAEEDEDAEIDVPIRDDYRIEDLSLGLSDVTLQGKVLDVDSVRTFDRDDGSEGRVANLTLGDETGRIRVTLWDDRTEFVEEVEAGEAVEVVDGYVRERDGSLELHVGNRGAIDVVDADVEYVPETTPIEDLDIDQVVDIGGVVRSADPKRTFDRDDGSEGQVRNVRIQDETGDIRVALWGEKADVDLAPGDTAYFADVEIKEGWQDDLEASAGWRSTVTVTESPAAKPDVDVDSDDESDDTATLSSFEEGTADATGSDRSESNEGAEAEGEDGGDRVEFTGTVVQTGDPVILDDGTETLRVVTDADVTLGQEVTARGRLHEGRLDAEDLV